MQLPHSHISPEEGRGDVLALSLPGWLWAGLGMLCWALGGSLTSPWLKGILHQQPRLAQPPQIQIPRSGLFCEVCAWMGISSCKVLGAHAGGALPTVTQTEDGGWGMNNFFLQFMDSASFSASNCSVIPSFEKCFTYLPLWTGNVSQCTVCWWKSVLFAWNFVDRCPLACVELLISKQLPCACNTSCVILGTILPAPAAPSLGKDNSVQDLAPTSPALQAVRRKVSTGAVGRAGWPNGLVFIFIFLIFITSC